MKTNELHGPPTGPGSEQHAHGYPQVDLNFWDHYLDRLTDARSASDAVITGRLLGTSMPHSPAIDRALSGLPLQDKLHLLHTDAEYEHHEVEESGLPLLRALERCSEALAVADMVVGRFVMNPTRIAPEQMDSAATALEETVKQLKTFNVNED